METTINIKNVNIKLPLSLEGLLPAGLLESIPASGIKVSKGIKDAGILSIDEAPDGVYMLTDGQKLIRPDFFGLHKGSKPVHAVVVIDAGRKVAIDLEESEKELCMLEECKSIGKGFGKEDEAVQDFDGEANTVALLKEGSPAAKYCHARGIHLPSAGEMKLASKYRELVDAALVMAGGEPFRCAYYWTSTQYDSSSAWMLHWSVGYVNTSSKDYSRRVRAFAAL